MKKGHPFSPGASRLARWLGGMLIAGWLTGCGWAGSSSRPGESPSKENKMAADQVTVRLLDGNGQLTGPVRTPRVVKPEAEWRRQLTPEQYRIARGQETERPFCGRFYDHKQAGVYFCVCCGLPLFAADAKFDSGTGWPSFFRPIAPENVSTVADRSLGMVREEIRCVRCDAHLGHVFDDGPKPTGRRYCLNSEALRFSSTR